MKVACTYVSSYSNIEVYNERPFISDLPTHFWTQNNSIYVYQFRLLHEYSWYLQVVYVYIKSSISQQSIQLSHICLWVYIQYLTRFILICHLLHDYRQWTEKTHFNFNVMGKKLPKMHFSLIKMIISQVDINRFSLFFQNWVLQWLCFHLTYNTVHVMNV